MSGKQGELFVSNEKMTDETFPISKKEAVKAAVDEKYAPKPYYNLENTRLRCHEILECLGHHLRHLPVGEIVQTVAEIDKMIYSNRVDARLKAFKDVRQGIKTKVLLPLEERRDYAKKMKDHLLVNGRQLTSFQRQSAKYQAFSFVCQVLANEINE